MMCDKTVLLFFSIVAQKKLAAVAIPYNFSPLLSSVVVAAVAVMRFFRSSSWEVIFTESLSWWYSRWVANSFTAVVLSNHAFAKSIRKSFTDGMDLGQQKVLLVPSLAFHCTVVG